MLEELQHSHEYIMVYGTPTVWVCQRCKEITTDPPPSYRRAVDARGKRGVYLFSDILNKTYDSTAKYSIIYYKIDYIWNTIKKELYLRRRATYIISYNKSTNRLYRIYKRSKSKKWFIRDISYNPWMALPDTRPFGNNIDHEFIASRGHSGVLNILKMIDGHDAKESIARMLRGGKNLKRLKLNVDDLKHVMTSNDDRAKQLVHYIRCGWGSAGINAIEAVNHKKYNGLPRDYKYLRSKLLGTETQLGEIAGMAIKNKRLAGVVDDLRFIKIKIPYARLKHNLVGLRYFIDAHRRGTNEELSIILYSILKEEGINVRRRCNSNIIVCVYDDGMYAVAPSLPDTMVAKDDGTGIIVNINNPTSIKSILEFINDRRKKEIRRNPGRRPKIS
jgi:hypothetical protein